MSSSSLRPEGRPAVREMKIREDLDRHDIQSPGQWSLLALRVVRLFSSLLLTAWTCSFARRKTWDHRAEFVRANVDSRSHPGLILAPPLATWRADERLTNAARDLQVRMTY